ncbi:MAG: nucleotide exchange factor GrpE [Pseudomonadota bacterium]
MTKAKGKPEAKAPEPEDQKIPAEELISEDDIELDIPPAPDEAAQSPTIESMALQLAEKDSEIGELKDQLLRTLAEAENVRRRADRDRQDAAKYAAAPLARDLLAVADNLARAIQSLRKDSAEDDKIASLLAGVELTQKELLNAFDKHNISKVDPIGERLDPHRHEAMFEVPHETAPHGTVVQVIEPGYLLHDRLLRPARVGVAKALPKAAEPKTPEENQGEDEPKLKSSA